MGHYPEKKALVLGGEKQCVKRGFIGSHMVKRLKKEGYWVRGVDLDHPEFGRHEADEFVIGDLRDKSFVNRVVEFKGWQGNFYNQIPYKMIESFDEIYQFAADMGGAGFIFTGENDADIMHNSATINLNLLDAIVKTRKKIEQLQRYFIHLLRVPIHHTFKRMLIILEQKKRMHIQINPDSEYGWEKLFSERLYYSYSRNYNIPVRVLLDIITSMGPEGTWEGGREKGSCCNL